MFHLHLARHLSKLLCREGGLKWKLNSAIREIEFHRSKLEKLKSAVEDRREAAFHETLNALRLRDDAKASVYANEHTELKKAVRVLKIGLLALTQVKVRLDTLRDFGEIAYHVASAFEAVRDMSGSFSELGSTLEYASEGVSAMVADTLGGMCSITAPFSIDTDGESMAIVESALKYAKQKALEAEIELGHQGFDGARSSKHGLRASSSGFFTYENCGLEDAVRSYVSKHGYNIDVGRLSVEFNASQDEVEQVLLKVLSEDRVRSSKEYQREMA